MVFLLRRLAVSLLLPYLWRRWRARSRPTSPPIEHEAPQRGR